MSPCWHVSSNRMIRKPIAQFHGSFRSTTLIKRGFILVLKYITFFPTFPWQGLLNYTRKIDNKRTHLWKKTPFRRSAKRNTYKGLEVGATSRSRKMSTHALEEMTRDLFWAMSLVPRQKHLGWKMLRWKIDEAMVALFWQWQRCNFLPL